MTKRSNGRNLIVGGVRFDSGVDCYGNKSVNKMRRDCLAANKPPRSFAKARREKKRKRESAYHCSPVLVSVTPGSGLMIYRRFSHYTHIQKHHINEACICKLYCKFFEKKFIKFSLISQCHYIHIKSSK